MKILLTGSSGMVGRNIVDLHDKAKHILLTPGRKELDLLDRLSVFDYFELNRPDLVIHAAGIVGGIQANINHPMKFLSENVQIGENVISGAINAKVAHFINLGSSCMYPKDIMEPLKEEMILTGELEPTNEGYAVAKILALKMCQYHNQESAFSNYKTLIPCNLYGKYDKFDQEWGHMIPSAIKKVLDVKSGKSEGISIWGDGTVRREFMYAEDLADFVWYAVENLDKIPELLNVGLGYDYSINEYYKVIQEIVGCEGEMRYDLSKPVGMKRKLVDISRLKKTGWKSTFSLKEGIAQTIKFYTNNKKNEN